MLRINTFLQFWQVITTRSHCLLFNKRTTDWDSPLGYKQPGTLYDIFIINTPSDCCNNRDILILHYDYNLSQNVWLHSGRNMLFLALISSNKNYWRALYLVICTKMLLVRFLNWWFWVYSMERNPWL